jgi:Fur family ferric uptake transcriptional regulator
VSKACVHKRQSLSEITQRLRHRALKLTGQRQAVLEVLSRNQHPLSAKELHASMKGGDCDLATVYRCLHALEKAGIAKRYDLGDGVARFELLCEGDDGHHHHLVCTGCSEVIEIEDCCMLVHEAEIARQNGFKRVTHKLEFFGICPACQRTSA